jgi:ABC-type siderophore export system fused ATPase/permease subunit
MQFSTHTFETMVKRQNGLTIIQLMVLLLIAGIVGSLLLKGIIEHRCQSDPSASLCIRHASAAALKTSGRISRQPV